MSQVILPGSNTLTLCASALQLILQDHLSSRTYGGRDDPKVRVTGVQYDEPTHAFAFTLTTDPLGPDPQRAAT